MKVKKINFKKTLNKRMVLTLVPCLVFGATSIGLASYFIVEQNVYNSHVIGKSNSAVFGQKEDNYVILEYLGTPTAKSMVNELRKLESISELGWYIIDYSNFTTDELTNMGIEYDPQYRFVTTTTNDDGSKEKKLLYSSYGLKTAEAIDKEFRFVDDYGIPDPSDVSKTGDNVQIYYTNLDYTAGSEQIKLDLNLMTSDKTPMTFDIKNLSVVDLDSETKEDDYIVTTSVEGGRVSYDPYDVPDESEEEYNSTPVTMPLTIKIPEGKREGIRGLKLVYHVANKTNEEKNEDALRYTTESGTSIDESRSFKLPTPVMTMNTSTNKVEISTSTDSGTYTKKDKNYYFYTYKGSYKEGESEKEISISLKSETTLSLNNGEDINYEIKDNVISFNAEEKTYSFTLNKENRTLLGSIKSEDEEIKDIELKADLGAIKTLTTTENGNTKEYKLDLDSDNFKYYYKFKESDEWKEYDVESGIKSEDIVNNRVYVRSEYKYKDENGEITIYSMVGQYVKPFEEDINVSFKIRLK